jgi:hypothetical protein
MPVVRIKFYFREEIENNWFIRRPPRRPTEAEWVRFFAAHLGKKYDVALYPWTTLQYFVRHWFNHRIPRLLDDRYTCWELEQEWEEMFNVTWGSKYDCPLITDLLREIMEPNKRKGIRRWFLKHKKKSSPI